MNANKVAIKGFTLIELAIALTIVSVVVGGLSIPISKRVAEQQYTETQAHIDKAVDALVGFAITNGRLPCPDIATATSSALPDNRDGIEDVTLTGGKVSACGAGVNTQTYGGSMNYTKASTDLNGASWGDLPWRTLGLSPPDNADAWSNRLRYAVFTPLTEQTSNTSGACSSQSYPYGMAALGCLTAINGSTNSGQLDIRCANPSYNITGYVPVPGCSASTTPPYSMNTFAVFVVYSVGANGWGSTNINNVLSAKPFPTATPSLIPDQAANAPEYSLNNTMSIRKYFVVRARTESSSNAGEYDDVLSFMSAATLAAKLLNAGVWPPINQLP